MMLRKTAIVVLLTAAAGGAIAAATGAYSSSGASVISHTAPEQVLNQYAVPAHTHWHAVCNNGHDMPKITGDRYYCNMVNPAGRVTWHHVDTVLVTPDGWKLVG